MGKYSPRDFALTPGAVTTFFKEKYLFADYISHSHGSFSMQTLQWLLIQNSVSYTCAATELHEFHHAGLVACSAHIYKKHLLHAVHYP